MKDGIQPIDRETFIKIKPEIGYIYQEAFSGYPWFEELSFDTIDDRLSANISKPGFSAFVAYGEQQELAGSLWFDLPTFDELEIERGSALRILAERICEEKDIKTIIWEREVMVRPKYQGQGIATKLRTAFIGYIGGAYEDGTLILTRMRDDNSAIIKIAEKLGFSRSGIQMPSRQNPETNHEYWYNIIK